MDNGDDVGVRREGYPDAPGVAVLRIDRPHVKNALRPQDLLAMNRHLQDCQFDPNIRVVVLTGTGDAFCAGADLKHRNDRAAEHMVSASEVGADMTTRIVSMPQIVIAAVNGASAGLGNHITLACDLCIAKDSAAFHFTGASKGIPSQQIGALLLPVTIGLKHAKDLLINGGRLSASRAHQLGMVNTLLSEDAWEDGVRKAASDISTHDPRVMAHNKYQMNQIAFQSIGALKLSSLAGAAYHAATPFLPTGRLEGERQL